MYPVAVGDGGGERLEDRDAHAFSRYVAVAAGAEAAAPAVGSGEPALAQVNVLGGVNGEVHAANHGCGDISPAQRVAGEMQRGERGRTHRVQRQARSAEVKEMRDPVGDRGVRRAEVQRVAMQRLLGLVQLVLRVHDADVDAHIGAGQCGGSQATVLERVPGLLQEKAFLRVHPLRFAWGDVEEGVVEGVDVADETAPLAVGLARLAGHRVEVARHVPAAGRYLGDAVAPRLQAGPELVEVVGEREAAA